MVTIRLKYCHDGFTPLANHWFHEALAHLTSWFEFFCQSQYNCPELSAFKLFGSTQSGVCPLKYWILKKPVNLVKYHNRYLSICASLIAKYVYNIPKFVSKIFCENIKVKIFGMNSYGKKRSLWIWKQNWNFQVKSVPTVGLGGRPVGQAAE